MSGLVETYRGAVYPWHCDHMGHMNVMWYVGKFDEATWNLFAGLGTGAAWLREQQRGWVAVEQRLAYQSELVAGDTVVVRSAILEVRSKAVRFVHQMHKGASDQLAAVCQLVGVHIDTETRKAVALPEEVALRAREYVTALTLPWDRTA